MLASDVYVDDDWAGLLAGVDPDGPGPATEIGVDAFATIQAGVDAVDASGVVNIFDGTYAETLLLTREVTLQADTVGGVALDAGGAATAMTVATGVTATITGVEIGGFTDLGIDAQGNLVIEESSLTGASGVGILVAAGSLATVEQVAFDSLAVGLEVAGGAILTANVFGGVAANDIDLRLDATANNIVITGGNTFTAADYYIENRSSLAINLTGAPSTLFDAADNFRIEDRLYHAPDDPASGLIRVAAGQLYVTAPSTGENDETIQAAIDAAEVGDVINVESGVFVEDLTIETADVELLGAGAGITTIEGIATNPQTSFPLATPNINVLASGVAIHGFTILSPDVAAGDYSSGIVIDSPGVQIYDNEFISRQGDAAPTGANDSLTNVMIQTWAGANSGKASNVDGLSVHDNTFTGGGRGYYGLFVNPQADPVGVGAAAALNIAGNTFTGNIWRAIEVERSNALVTGNLIAPGAETLHAWGGSGISVRNFTGDPLTDITLTGNTVMGADATLGQGFANGVLVGFGAQAIDLTIDGATSLAHHEVGLQINAGSVDFVAGSISQNAHGVRAASGEVTLSDVELAGNDTGVHIAAGATAKLLGATAALTGGAVGVDIDGGAALVEGYDLNGNTIGVRVQNDGVADLGQTGAGVDFTGLGISGGGNDFSGYTAAATSTAGAIVNLNSAGDYANPGPQGLAGPTFFDIAAIGNLFSATLSTPADIESVIYHDVDDTGVGFVEFATLAALTASLDALPTLVVSQQIDEGGNVTVSGEFTNVAQPHTVTITWGDGTPDTVIPLAAGVFAFSTSSPAGTYVDDPDGSSQTATYPVSILVEETAGVDSLVDDSLSVEVSNVAPVLPLADADGDNEIDEAETFNLMLGPIVDPGDDTVLAYEIDWGDGTTPEFITGDPLTTAVTRSHTFADGAADPARTIRVDVLDEDGTWMAAGTLVISVNNIAPTATNYLPFQSTVNEGATTTVFFAEPFTDPGVSDGPFRFAYDFNGNGVYGEAGELGSGTYAGSIASSFAVVPSQFLADDDDSPRTVNARIIDKDNGFTEYALAITILNVAPVVEAGPDDTAFVDAPVDHLVSFTDPGAEGQWTVSIDWDGVAGFEESFTVPTRSFNLADFSSRVFTTGDIGSTFTVTVQIDDNDGGVDSDAFDLTIVEDTLQVVDFALNPSGFSVRFNRAIDLSVLNLYNGFSDTTIDAADLTLVGDNVGLVRGSLDWDAATNTLDFIKTGGVLEGDTYTLTLFSGAHTPAVSGSIAFQDTGGADLDGDGDTIAGDDYVRTFVVAPPPRTLSLPDFARGPGQVVDLSPTTTGPGTLELPIILSDANGVFSIDFDLIYDPAILSISVPTNNVPLGPTMPSGWNALGNFVSPGVLRVSVTGTNPLTGANLPIVDLAASVHSNALYGDQQIIRFENVSVNEGAIAAVADRAVHKLVFVGDTSGSANYTGFDASLISRVRVGIDSGFEAFDDTDPRILADVTGDATISGFDSSLVNREALNFGGDPGFILEIPPVPAGAPTQSPGLVDPQLSIPTGVLGNGTSVTAPVNIDIESMAEGGVIAATFKVTYDPTLLSFQSAELGAATPSESGWNVHFAEPTPGVMVASLFGSAPPLMTGASQLSLLRFDVLTSSATPTVVEIQPLDPADAGLLWTAVNGSIDLSRLAGDYNSDGVVDAIDYAVWRELSGTTTAPYTSADGDGDGQIDGADYLVWRRNYGAALPAAAPLGSGSGAVAEAEQPVETAMIAAAAFEGLPAVGAELPPLTQPVRPLQSGLIPYQRPQERLQAVDLAFTASVQQPTTNSAPTNALGSEPVAEADSQAAFATWRAGLNAGGEVFLDIFAVF